jgi:hypothetical protein
MMMLNPTKASQHEQGTFELFQQRKGRFTGSQISRLLVKDGLGDGAETYTKECLREEELDFVQQGFQSPAMARGNQLEADAADYYALKTGFELTEVGFLQFGPHAGVSADRLIVQADKGIEIKCPEETAHFKMGAIKDEAEFAKKFKNYYAQCQFNMMAWRASSWDFISFFPDDPKYRCFHFTFYPNKKLWGKIILSIRNAAENKKRIKALWQKNLF